MIKKNDFKSKLSCISVAYVSVDKIKDSHDIYVLPIEVLPDTDGDLQDAIDEASITATNDNDIKVTVVLKSSSFIRAKWLPLASNRVTSPDIKRGEKVMLWRLGDTDTYYWSELGLDDHLRRLERVIYAWAANPEEKVELDISEDMYSFEVDTYEGHVTLHTSTKNGEPFEYTVHINTKEGYLFITDNDDNAIILNSAETGIRLVNKDKTEVFLDKRRLYAHVHDKLEAVCNGTADVYVKDLIKLKCDGEVFGEVTKLVDITCKGPFIARAPEMQLGEDDAVESSVLGDTHADGHKALQDTHNQHQHIGNMGVPTGVPIVPMDIGILLPGGDSYSKVNKNQ